MKRVNVESLAVKFLAYGNEYQQGIFVFLAYTNGSFNAAYSFQKNIKKKYIKMPAAAFNVRKKLLGALIFTNDEGVRLRLLWSCLTSVPRTYRRALRSEHQVRTTKIKNNFRTAERLGAI